MSVNAIWTTSTKQTDALIYAVTAALWEPSTRKLLDSGHAKGKSIKLDPKRAQRDRDAIVEALRKSTAPLSSREVIFAVLGDKPDKKRRDHIYWALKVLRDDGTIAFKDKLYQPLPKVA